MSDTKNFLLPLILDILSHKPLMCETENRLFSDIDKELGNDSSNSINLKKQFKSTVDMGKGLGILSVQDEEVRMPFLLKNTKPTLWSRKSSKPKVNPSKVKKNSQKRQAIDNFVREPSSSKVKPKVNTLVYRSRSRSRTALEEQKTKKNKK